MDLLGRGRIGGRTLMENRDGIEEEEDLLDLFDVDRGGEAVERLLEDGCVVIVVLGG